jgi:hypothetical protein
MNYPNVIGMSIGSTVYGASYLELATPIIFRPLVRSSGSFLSGEISVQISPYMDADFENSLQKAHLISLSLGVAAGIVAAKVSKCVWNFRR